MLHGKTDQEDFSTVRDTYPHNYYKTAHLSRVEPTSSILRMSLFDSDVPNMYELNKLVTVSTEVI